MSENLIKVQEKMKKPVEIRIINLPKCRMATSGVDNFGKTLGNFPAWWEEYDKKREGVSFAPYDFMWYENGQQENTVWCRAVEKSATSPDCGGYDIIDFEGGLYAEAVGIDDDAQTNGMIIDEITNWVHTSNFEVDIKPGREIMFQMLDSTEESKNALGFDQMDIYVPIKVK